MRYRSQPQNKGVWKNLICDVFVNSAFVRRVFKNSEAVVSQVLAELGLQIADQISGKLII